jgi:LPXTG-site transpeptidase (sortase) family protein
MLDLQQKLHEYIDDGVPSVTVDEIRSRARRHTRTRMIAATVIVCLVVAASLAVAAQLPHNDRGVTSTATTTPSARWRPTLGQTDGEISVPAIKLYRAFVEGVSIADLRAAPGHDPHSALPGEPGTVVIEGHRTTHGAPFYDLNNLRAGDRITIVMPYGTFQYKVRDSVVVLPHDVSGAIARSHAALALVTQHPKFSKSHRLVVFADAG